MSLFEEWKNLAYAERTQEEYNEFWNKYLPQEQSIYEYILENKEYTIEGTISELAEKFNIPTINFIGFLDGINTSLTEELDIDSLKEDSSIKLNIDLEKLYYNMHGAKADWLYNLPQWDNIFSIERRKEIKKEYNKSRIVINDKKIGRNESCPCGSGKKYKKCCLNK